MRIFSGIRASGDKTLGNYSGGFRQYVATQEQGDAFFCVVDLHSITTPFEPAALHESTLSVAAMLFATGPRSGALDGLRPEPRHGPRRGGVAARLGHELRRAAPDDPVQGASPTSRSSSPPALFNYPVLMAGDILLYQADIVPIGDDQRQHLELARNIAERFNGRFGETFKVPEGVFPEEGARIKNLQEPERLMSTTRGAPQGVVRMIDPPDVVRKKFKTAVTDSGTRRAPRPGGEAGRLEPDRDHGRRDRHADRRRSRRRYDGQGYGQFKEDVAEAVVELLVSDPAALRGAAGGRGRAAPAARARRREGARGASRRRSRRCTSAWALSGRSAGLAAPSPVLAVASPPASSISRTPSRWRSSSSRRRARRARLGDRSRDRVGRRALRRRR